MLPSFAIINKYEARTPPIQLNITRRDLIAVRLGV